MAQTVKLKRSATPSNVPTTAQLDLGEVAINTYDGKMFIKKDDGTEAVVEVGAGGSTTGIDNQTYTATASQTTFNVNYVVGYVEVYLNGFKLLAGTDYTATNGTSIVLATGATAGSIVDCVGYTGTINVGSAASIDGGAANSIYLPSQLLNGGSASG